MAVFSGVVAFARRFSFDAQETNPKHPQTPTANIFVFNVVGYTLYHDTCE